ncbi:MAG: AAA family ATPase [Egibacteraceae bacterium]
MKGETSLSLKPLLHQPELLFLDEPTAGLDPVNARRVKEIVTGLRDEGRTILLTTHDMAVAAELCDRVAFIVDGRIAVIDTPRALELRYGQRRRVRVEHRRSGRLETTSFPLDGPGAAHTSARARGAYRDHPHAGGEPGRRVRAGDRQGTHPAGRR